MDTWIGRLGTAAALVSGLRSASNTIAVFSVDISDVGSSVGRVRVVIEMVVIDVKINFFTLSAAM